MSSHGSITARIDQLRAGDPAAAEHLWQGYFQRLVALARQKLHHAPRGMADEEDVALSAFKSFCLGAEQGRFPQLSDRDDLWRLLLVITERKAIDLVNYERRKKRDACKVQSLDALRVQDSTTDYSPLDIPGPEPTPEFIAELTEECRRLLDLLGEEKLRAVAISKMEGYTNKEIAEREKVSEPTIERKLSRIRKLWERENER